MVDQIILELCLPQDHSELIFSIQFKYVQEVNWGLKTLQFMNSHPHVWDHFVNS